MRNLARRGAPGPLEGGGQRPSAEPLRGQRSGTRFSQIIHQVKGESEGPRPGRRVILGGQRLNAFSRSNRLVLYPQELRVRGLGQGLLSRTAWPLQEAQIIHQGLKGRGAVAESKGRQAEEVWTRFSQ